MTQHSPTLANSVVTAGKVEIGNSKKLSIIAGPCQLESRAHAFDMAGALKKACSKLGVGLIYKTSFDKANRSSASRRRAAWDLRTRCRSLPTSARISTCRC